MCVGVGECIWCVMYVGTYNTYKKFILLHVCVNSRVRGCQRVRVYVCGECVA